jgi:hypothetical protein
MKYQLLEIEQPCNDRKLIAKVDTMEELHKVLTELTDGKYVMCDYSVGDKTLHYHAKKVDREFEVFVED